MSSVPAFIGEVMDTLQVEHDLVMELTKEVKLLRSRVEQLEQKQ